MNTKETEQLLEDKGFRKCLRSKHKFYADLWQKCISGNVGSDEYYLNCWHYDTMAGGMIDFDVQIIGRDGINRNVKWFGIDIENHLDTIIGESINLFVKYDKRS